MIELTCRGREHTRNRKQGRAISAGDQGRAGASNNAQCRNFLNGHFKGVHVSTVLKFDRYVTTAGSISEDYL